MNHISILEYAYISQAVYHWKTPNSLPPFLEHKGWTIPNKINETTNFQSNFFARLYIKKDKDGNVTAAVIAFRGTKPFKHPFNDISDFKMAVLDELPISYKSARVFFHKARWYVRENYPDVPIKLTGHSLGGALAQLIAAKNEQVAVVFNSPGIGDLPDIHAGKTYHRNIHNINAKDDIVSKVGKVIGTIQTIEITEGENELNEASKIEHKNIYLMLGLAGLAAKETAVETEKTKGYFQQHLIANMIKALKAQPLNPPQSFY